MALAKLRKVGGSLVVTIPKELVEEGLKAGETVNIDIHKAKRSYFGAGKGVGPFTVEDEMRAHD